MGPCRAGDLTGQRDHRRPLVDKGRQNRRRDQGPSLFRANDAPDIEARAIKNL